MALKIPPRLEQDCRALARRWGLRLGTPFANASCAWVAPARLADGTPAVLKRGIPHMEAEHELPGLRFWNGDPAVRVLRADESTGAMLLECCEPGTPLRALDEPAQDEVIARMLRRLWRTPPMPHPFRPLRAMLEYWSRETLARETAWQDAGLVREGLRLFAQLEATAAASVLLARICMPGTFCGPPANRGWSSIRSRLPAIRHTMLRNIYLIARSV